MTMGLALWECIVAPPGKIDDCDIQASRVLDALFSLVGCAGRNDSLTLTKLQIPQ